MRWLTFSGQLAQVTLLVCPASLLNSTEICSFDSIQSYCQKVRKLTYNTNEIFTKDLARGLGFKVKGRVEKQDCNEQ